MEKFIIFGGAGFIGSNLALSALDQGHEVVIFDNLSRTGTDLNLRTIREHGGDRVIFHAGDIRSTDDIASLYDRHSDAKAAFHLAGQVAVTTSIKNPREDFDINLLGTLNILEAMRERQLKMPLLYASTNKVYGDLKSLSLNEGDQSYTLTDYSNGIPETFPLDFHSPYGCSKGGADQYALDYARVYGLRTVVLRQSCIYGYQQFGVEDQGWVAWFTIASLFERPITIYGNGKQVRDILFIDDLIDAYWKSLEHIDIAGGRVYNIGGGAYRLSLLQLLDYLETLMGKPIPVNYAQARQGDQKIFVCDTTRAQTELNWKPRIDPEEGVRRLLHWIQNHTALFHESGLLK